MSMSMFFDSHLVGHHVHLNVGHHVSQHDIILTLCERSLGKMVKFVSVILPLFLWFSNPANPFQGWVY